MSQQPLTPDIAADRLVRLFEVHGLLREFIATLQAAGFDLGAVARITDPTVSRALLVTLLKMAYGSLSAVRSYRETARDDFLRRGVHVDDVVGWADSTVIEDEALSILAAVASVMTGCSAAVDIETFVTGSTGDPGNLAD